MIETPVDRVFDVGGWDIAKALTLLLKGNAVVVEWLTSPIVYDGEEGFLAEFRALADRVLDRSQVMRHYLHLGERIRRTDLPDPSDVPLKKLFYALRPAIMLRWMRLHPARPYGPMHFPTLIGAAELPGALEAVIDDLLARKAVTRELGRGAMPAALEALMDAEFAEARRTLSIGEPEARDGAARREAEAFFRRTVGACGAAGA